MRQIVHGGTFKRTICYQEFYPSQLFLRLILYASVCGIWTNVVKSRRSKIQDFLTLFENANNFEEIASLKLEALLFETRWRRFHCFSPQLFRPF